MTIRYFAACIITGLSGDTKPDHSGLNTWRFLETDTGKSYVHNGSTWVNITGEARAETLTNKTINVDQNTVKHSTTNAAGDILRNTGTSFARFARGAASQVLATNAAGTDIEWTSALAGAGDVSTTQSNTFGDFDQVFRSGRLHLRNPANNAEYQFTASAITADRILTVPLLDSSDTLVTEAMFQALTNKTFDTVENNLVSTSITTGDILVSNGIKFVRKARGTANQVLRTNAAGTDLEYASLQSERVGKHTATGNGSATAFTIAHGLGALPSYTFISVGSSGTTVKAAKADSDATNITVTFASAPENTTSVVIYWRVVA